jgi:serine phosphatase RsbU (regulator of sigma subunit)
MELKLSKKQQELDQDLIQASHVQKSILTPPSVYQAIKGLDIDIRYMPMNGRVSGDYYNITRLDNAGTSILLADASGHGIQAALSTMQMGITNEQTLGHNPGKRLRMINDIFNKNPAGQNFFTAFILEISPGQVRYSSAAHPDQYLLKRKTLEVVPLKTKGKVIGMIPDQTYEMKTLPVEKGDCIFLFTDGLIEELNFRNEEFGKDRLLKFIKEETKNRKSGEINDRLLENVNLYTQGQPVKDDITLITIRI